MPVLNKARALVRGVVSASEPIRMVLLGIPIVGLAVRVVQEMGNDDATHMAAGVAYYAIISLFPLILGLIFIFSFILESETVEREMLHFFQTYLPGTEDILTNNVSSVKGVRGFLGVVGLLGLFWSASALFGAISRAVDRAWDVHEDRPFYVAKFHHLVMAMTVGLLFLLSLGATSSIQFAGGLGLDRFHYLEDALAGLFARALPFVFTLAIFLMIYKHVPNTTTQWRYIWPGALLAALCFELGKTAFLFYLDNYANYARVYGSLGAVISLLVWTYISSFILILGAEVCSEHERMRKGVKRGTLVGK